MPATAVEATPTIPVALGIVLREDKVLVGWRNHTLYQGGCWEFPGGKVKTDETPRQAVVRELKEEVGLEIKETDAEPLIEFAWHYDAQRYFFNVYTVKDSGGTPVSRFYNYLRWYPVSALEADDLPPANHAIIKALSLPNRYLITPAGHDIDIIEQGLNKAFQSDISVAVFRAPELDSQTYMNNARRLLSQNPTFSNKLLIHNQPTQVGALNAAGVQLSAEYAKKYRNRPIAAESLLAISCHNQAELEHACRLNADFALLGPVKTTPSHPDSLGLGWHNFKTLVKNVPLPVYAVGGLSGDDLADCRAYGAQGVAAIRGFWQP